MCYTRCVTRVTTSSYEGFKTLATETFIGSLLLILIEEKEGVCCP